MYFEKGFPAEFEINPDPDLINAPRFVRPADLQQVPTPGASMDERDFEQFVRRTAEEIALALNLDPVGGPENV